MYKYILSLTLVTTIICAEEVSTFGAGDLDAKNPYGLNASEKHILKNQKNIGNLSLQLNDLNSLIKSVNKRLEGLESIYEGDSSKLNDTVLKVNTLMEKVDISNELVSKNQEDTNLREEKDKKFKSSLSVLRKNMKEISSLVNKINSEYISSKEFQKNMSQFVTKAEFEEFKKSIGKASKTSTKIKTHFSKKEVVSSSKKVIKKEKVDDLSTSAKRAQYMKKAKLEYSKNSFSLAIPKFEKLVELNYKPATSNYYLGQIWYAKKNYEKAISHYKKSALLYDKASYMPTLLLHCAISFEKLNDKVNAKSFYGTLIDLYPSSKSAKIAKNNLKKL